MKIPSRRSVNYCGGSGPLNSYAMGKVVDSRSSAAVGGNVGVGKIENKQTKWLDSYGFEKEKKKTNETKTNSGLLWHIDCYEKSFLLSSKSDIISSLVSLLVESHLQRNPFSHSQTVFSKQQSRFLESVHRKHVRDTAIKEEDDNRNDSKDIKMIFHDKYPENENNKSTDFELYMKDNNNNSHNKYENKNDSDNSNINNNHNNNDNNDINNKNDGKNNLMKSDPLISEGEQTQKYFFDTKKETVFRPKTEATALWSNYPLNDALTKLKEQRSEAANCLTHVHYIILPVRTSSIGRTGKRNLNKIDDDDDDDDDDNFDRDEERMDEPKRLQRSPKSTSFSTSISSSHSVFSIDGLSRLRLSYTAPWPINTLITPDLLRITLKSTKRLIEIAQLSALIRLVWSDLRRKKIPSSPTPNVSRTSSTATSSHFRKLSMTEIRSGPTTKTSSSSSSTSSSFSEYDRDSSYALHLVQQSILPLGSFTSDRIRVQQLKFRQHLLDASKDGFEGVERALMCSAENISTAIFADNDDEKDEEDEKEEETKKEEIQQYDEFSIDSNNNDKNNKKNILKLNNFNEIIDDDDLSISDLICLLLSSCRNVLRVIEFSSIKINELNEIKDDDKQKKFESFNQVSPLYKKRNLDIKLQKEKQIIKEVNISINKLIKCRKNLLLAVKRIAKDERNQDAVIFLLFFNE